MTSRERIRQLYYEDRPGSRKYLIIGVIAIAAVLVLFLVSGGQPPDTISTTTTTEQEQPGPDLEQEVSNIKNSLDNIINKIERPSG